MSPDSAPVKPLAHANVNSPPSVRGAEREARVLVSLTSVHEARHGGPRGNVPGRNDSMRTI